MDIRATPIAICYGCARAPGSLPVVSTCPTVNEGIAKYSHLFPKHLQLVLNFRWFGALHVQKLIHKGYLNMSDHVSNRSLRRYRTLRVWRDGFGGLWLACWPLAPKFAGSNPAEAVGFFGRKNPQHAFLRRGSKRICPMSQLCGM